MYIVEVNRIININSREYCNSSARKDYDIIFKLHVSVYVSCVGVHPRDEHWSQGVSEGSAIPHARKKFSEGFELDQ